jgi:hypothetical protein
MVCELNTKKELSLAEFIKILYEFNNVEALTLCVKNLKEKYTLDEVKNLSDEELYKYFVEAEKMLR